MGQLDPESKADQAGVSQQPGWGQLLAVIARVEPGRDELRRSHRRLEADLLERDPWRIARSVSNPLQGLRAPGEKLAHLGA